MATATTKVIIQRLFVKKTIRDTFAVSIASDGVWYSTGFHDTKTVKDIHGHALKEGDTISFTYEDGQYKNVQMNTLEVITSTTSQGKPANSSTTKLKKVFGIVESVQTNDKGYFEASIIDQNGSGSINISAGKKENSFGTNAVELKPDQKIACSIGSYNTVQGEIKLYQGKPNTGKNDLAIRLGNAMTFASWRVKDGEDIVHIAKTVVPKVGVLREVLTEKHPEMDNYSLGARLGQCVILCAQHADKSQSVDEVLTLVPDLFESVCKAEAELSEVLEKEKEEQPKEESKAPEKEEPTKESPKEEKGEEQKQADLPPVTPKQEFDWDDDIPF